MKWSRKSLKGERGRRTTKWRRAKCSPEKAQLFALGTQNACIYNNSSNGPMAWPPLIPVFYLVTEQGLFHRATIIPDLQSYPRSLLKVQMKEEMSTEFPFLDMPLLAESESEWKWSFSAIAQLYTKLCDGSGMKYSPIWPCLLDSNAREQQHLYSWNTYDHHNRRNPMIVIACLCLIWWSDKEQTKPLPPPWYYVPNCM